MDNLVGFVAGAVVGLILFFVGADVAYRAITWGSAGKGTEIGIVTALSRRGVVCKTMEGRMSIGRFSNGAGTVSKREFHFTVPDNRSDLLHTLEISMNTNAPVSIVYESGFVMSGCSTESGNFVTAVNVIE